MTDEIYVNVLKLKLGEYSYTSAVVQRIMNSGVVKAIMKQALASTLVGIVKSNDNLDKLLYAGIIVPSISFSAGLVAPVRQESCPPSLSCIEVVDTELELDAPADMFGPNHIDALLTWLGPLGVKLRQHLGPCCGEQGLWWLPSEAVAALKEALVWSKSSLGLTDYNPTGPQLEYDLGMDVKFNVNQLFKRLRKFGGLDASLPFLERHPEADGEWVTFMLADSNVKTSMALKRPHLDVSGSLVLENLEVDGRQVMLVKLENAGPGGAPGDYDAASVADLAGVDSAPPWRVGCDSRRGRDGNSTQ